MCCFQNETSYWKLQGFKAVRVQAGILDAANIEVAVTALWPLEDGDRNLELSV